MERFIGDMAEIMAYNNLSLEHPNYKDKRLLFLKVRWIWLQIKWRIISYFN